MILITIWLIFVFVLGCCIGSFLNVVVYRMPRDLSLLTPGSFCPGCNSPIRFYDNIPLLSWLILGTRCRDCKTPISARYFIIELLTGILFATVFALYFVFSFRSGLERLLPGGWFIYMVHIILLAALLAASTIDLELWVIPLGICWMVTIVGLAASTLGIFIIDPKTLSHFRLLPTASATSGALATGAGIGLAISMLLLATGVIKRSYQSSDAQEAGHEPDMHLEEDENFNHRREVLREVFFLLPIIICSAAMLAVSRNNQTIKDWWLNLLQVPAIKGFLGSLWGYFVGCAIVWTTRILGTLAFGKEAMGLGDVHLLGAAGTVIGPFLVVIAFFLAPFFGLAWALYQMFFKKTRQIPYGPFLSFAVFIAIICHDQIINRLAFLLVR